MGLALGVAPGSSKRDYYLGATIQAPRESLQAAARLAEEVRKQSKGECVIRVVPRVAKRAARSGSWFQKKHRPLIAGASVGYPEPMAGTLGAFVQDPHDYYMLSNNHVLAASNSASPGTAIFQAGLLDGSATSGATAGILERFVPLSYEASGGNTVDAAIARLLLDRDFYGGWCEGLGSGLVGVRKVGTSHIGTKVVKDGRTTGTRWGLISQVDIQGLEVDYSDNGNPPLIAEFDRVIEVTSVNGKLFSDAGDSGSLIIDEDGYARALLFAGGTDSDGIDRTFANPIDLVLKELGVQLVLP